jgi:uncharacterized membrane protein
MRGWLLRYLQDITGTEMATAKGDLELMMVLYPDPGQAKTALAAIRAAEKDGELKLIDAAIIQKNQKGEASFHETQDLDAWRGTLFGAVAGALIGLLGGPLGMLVGGAVGAATGGAVAGSLDLGFSNRFLKGVKTDLRPGASALLVIVEPPYKRPFLKTVEPYMGRVYRNLLKSDVIQILQGGKEQ